MRVIIFALMGLLISINSAFAVTVKVAVVAPEDTTWGESLKQFSKEVKKATDGKVKFKVYYGGVAGDEPDVLRKIRINQLHGGVFTGRAMGDINGDVRAIEIPFSFYENREKAWKTLESASSFFNKGFEKNGFQNLSFFEIGLVYVVMTKKAKSLEEMKGLKIWSWEGDPLVASLVETMGLVSVPLPLPDVLSSLQTGVVHAAYSSPLGVVAMQWNTKVKYLVDFPVSFSVGAFLVSNKQWEKIPQKYQTIVRELAKKHIALANQKTIKENKEARAALKSLGVEFVKFPDKDVKQGAGIRKQVIQALKGKLFSDKAFNQVNKI